MRKYLLLLFVFTLGCARIPSGVNSGKILIKSKPTKAKIYVNNEYIGITPVCAKIWYEKEKFLNIKAEPIFPNQFPQNIYFEIPPIPPKLVIYMDYEVKIKVDIFEEQQKKEAKIAGLLENVKKNETAKVIEIIKIVKEPINLLLPIIYFETDKYNISDAAATELLEVVKLLENNPEYNLIIHAHADERGSIEYNRKLSLQRAMAVKQNLIEMELAENRLSIRVHGEQISFDEKEEKLEYKYNRFVDFSIKIENSDEEE